MNNKTLPIVPIFARVLLSRPLEEKTKGGILLPDAKRFSQAKGTILACGETCDEVVKNAIGKEVYFAKFAGDWINVNDKEYYICNDEDILGVLNNDGTDEPRKQ